ncbi:MAG TPA: pirin family protein [Candidatus Competibacteraceae bacterium]|nr:pirin family protein [Candidatus Competibacteraceae bacterium]
MSHIRPLERIVTGHPATDGAGVRLTRVIGTPECRHLDPFLMLDEFKSDREDDYIAGFPEHPHRGFETVTYLLAGRVRHADSVGNRGLLGPGAVQWMTAGRGIIHSEMPEREQGLLWGYQLWVNLPSHLKMSAPRYQDIPAERIPAVQDQGWRARVISGELQGVAGPAQSVTGILYLDVALEPGMRFELPLADALRVLVFAVEGEVASAASSGFPRLRVHQLGVFGQGETLALRGGERGGRVLVLAGRPLDEPIVQYGPFVMNSPEEIQQAILDYQRGVLDRV